MNEPNTLEAVKDILATAATPDADGSADEGPTDGDDAQALHHGGDDSRPGELDEPQPDEFASLEEDAPQHEDDDAAVTLKDLSEKLGLESADMYDLEVPMGKGEAATLGELKDAYKEYGPVKEAKEQIQAQRAEYERSIMQTRAELNGILAVIPPELRQAALDSGRQYNTQWEKTQREQVLEAIPEWKQADALQKDRDAIVAIGADYGFSEPEMQYTNDARTLRMLRDFSRMKSELEAAKSAAKVKRQAPGAPGKQNTRRLTKRRLENALSSAKSSSDPREKQKAISYLIGNN